MTDTFFLSTVSLSYYSHSMTTACSKKQGPKPFGYRLTFLGCCMIAFVLSVCSLRAKLLHSRTKRSVVKIQNLQHAMFHLGCTKMATLNFDLHPTGGYTNQCILLACAYKWHCNKLLIDFFERWLLCQNEQNHLDHIHLHGLHM